ncbi:MAG: AAA domain-containing protein [Lachnospiraceae bacterium]|nr:AAA domain-containing protein [Lachnospiraceae bacterium]
MSDILEQTINDGTEQSKVVSLFQFIRELNKLKQKAILNMKDYPWSFALSNLPDDPENIHVFWRDRVEDDAQSSDADSGSTLLSVHKPEFQKCPEPDEVFKDWLLPGWDDYRREASVKESIILEPEKESVFSSLFDAPQEKDGEEKVEPAYIYFNDDPKRVTALESWLVKRAVWVEKQKITARTRDLFADLYRLYFELQRESETEEIIAANGILCDRENPAIKHPVLTHRVKLDYDPDVNMVYILDTDVPSEMYSIAFQVMEDINLSGINSLSADLQKNDYHPLDRNDTPAFLKILVHQLSSESVYSEEGIPASWSSSNRLLLYYEPCYIVRKRLDGTLKAIEQIIENVQETGEVPAPIVDIVSGGTIEIPEDTGETSVEEQLAAVGGESVDILLSKEANKEQLEIARRIEYYNAVLVQGPPGTGKTHTIANLMGHFLAQGKSVLVTSYTTKALAVLKDKVAPGLQSLCVSILDDSNVDMERSVDGITGYMSKTTSHELKRDMDVLAVERRDIIKQLADVRRKIFAIINQECNCIVYNGEDISPSKAAEFVVDHSSDLSYIPGKVRLRAPLPLTFEQLAELYRSNEGVTVADEIELATNLPQPEQIMSPAEFSEEWNALQSALHRFEATAGDNQMQAARDTIERKLTVNGKFGKIVVDYPTEQDVQQLKEYAHSFGKIEKWMKIAAVDGKKGASFRQRWITLIQEIEKANAFAESIVSEQFGLNIQFAEPERIADLKSVYTELRTTFADKGKIGKLAMMMHKEYGPALSAVTLNGKQPQSAHDCDVVLHCIEMDAVRKQSAVYWDELLAVHGVPRFFDLDTANQERIAGNWVPYIHKYLDWYHDAYQPLLDKLSAVGIPADTIFEEDPLDSDIAATDKILSAVETVIPAICDLFIAAMRIEEHTDAIEEVKNKLTIGKRGSSRVCAALLSFINAGNTITYTEAYSELERMYAKYALQKNRIELLKILEPIAPQWAEAIRSRSDVHGQTIVPSDIEDAWKWKQLCGIVEEITATPFGVLQAESIRLSKEYRKVTARYAEKSAWYHLLRRTEADIDMKQALQGWKQTVKRIGKGTGKQAPALKAKARELMTKCQGAVPGWIMPINRALESLNPKSNRFDIIIIDEASQSDISSLAILYMGRKLVIVGDDKQVSPMAVGVEVDKMSALEQMYIKDKIPNSHLYNAKTSIYDIAATTFQPLMLREHFRCVPEIIGFSNMLSYDYKIKPLRDASNSTLLPAVVNYRVANGKREGKSKTNPAEARAIVALMQACMEQPEYAGKSFGVISLLGDEQVKIIQQLIEQEIDPKEIVSRSILCGNSANFQGDERDVIFLSVVDSGDGNGPIHLQIFGPDDSYRKRYNVAASRARDQLWVVDSLDPANDLKPGDIRKMLIEYSINPQAVEMRHGEIEEYADSPFEAAVATTLADRGYHLVQQWKVGAYRLDMVAMCGKKTVAIECDGERWHSGEAKIREDMERQTILERLGWRFIRIRGSEYYSNSEKTMERVFAELTNYGIEPEAADVTAPETRNTELLNRVKNRAGIILCGEDGEPQEPEEDTIAAALNGGIVTTTSEVPELPSIKQAVVATEVASTVTVSSEEPQISHEQETEAVEEKLPVSEPQQPVMPVKPYITSNSTSCDQQVLPGMEDLLPETDDIISLLKKNNVKYIDKRQSNGALWIIGGDELKPIVAKAKTLGLYFKFKPGGGKLTKGKDAWWGK